MTALQEYQMKEVNTVNMYGVLDVAVFLILYIPLILFFTHPKLKEQFK